TTKTNYWRGKQHERMGLLARTPVHRMVRAVVVVGCVGAGAVRAADGSRRVPWLAAGAPGRGRGSQAGGGSMNTKDLRELAKRAIPFLRDEGAKYEDDGSNEPLELARDIEEALSEHGGDTLK